MQSPQERKIVTNLGPLELTVMEKLWEGGPATVREMRDKVAGPSKAITTILTTMVRLYHKGLANRSLEKKGHLYSAGITREEWEEAAIKDTVQSLPTGAALACLHMLIDTIDVNWLDLIEREIHSWRVARGRLPGDQQA